MKQTVNKMKMKKQIRKQKIEVKKAESVALTGYTVQPCLFDDCS